jgi:hypothetical protein
LLIKELKKSEKVGLKMSSLYTLALKSPNRIFIWYLGNLSNTRSISLQKLSFTSLCLGKSFWVYFLWSVVVKPMPNPKAGEPPRGYLQLFIHCIRSNSPQLGAASSLSKLRTRHAIMKRDPPNMDMKLYCCIFYIALSFCTFLEVLCYFSAVFTYKERK